MEQRSNDSRGLEERVQYLEACLREKERKIRRLEQQEEEMRELYENAPIPYQSLDVEGRITAVNAAWRTQLGYSEEDVIDAYFGDLLPPAEEKQFRKNFARFKEEGRIQDAEFWLQKKDKTYALVSYEGKVSYDEDGNFLRTHCVFRDITEQRIAEQNLRESEERYRDLFNRALVGLYRARFSDGEVLECNDRLARIFGHESKDDIIGKYVGTRHFVDETVRLRMMELLQSRGEIENFEAQLYRHDGSRFWGMLSARLYPREDFYEGVIQDITTVIETEEALRVSEEQYRALIETSPDSIALLTEEGRFITANPAMAERTGISPLHLEGRSYHQVLGNDAGRRLLERARQTLKKGEIESFEEEHNGRHFENYVVFVPSMHTERTFQVISRDITEQKRLEEELRLMNHYDSQTGLYSRAFFDEELRRCQDERSLPLGVIICDTDGLKLINDSLGHECGDEFLQNCAAILDYIFRKSDVVARYGGDEFAVLLPNSDEETVHSCSERIHSMVEDYNRRYPEAGLSVSVGYAVQHEPPLERGELIKRADDAMYKEKLHKSYSQRHNVVKALITMMEARDHFSEGHGERTSEYSLRLGEELGLSEERLNDLSLLARFHDLGKAGIPDHILFKPGPLTEKETSTMQQHCEIGRRIASATRDLSSIADYILKHHERWDGSGYPLGMSGEDIPMECRIFSIADAYDSITHARPYKNGRSHTEAISELERCAGSQFDPYLVERFKTTF